MKRAMVHPGYVKSRTDGDIHFVTGAMLIRLYHLDPATTVIAKHGETQVRGRLTAKDPAFDHYYPRFDGKYDR